MKHQRQQSEQERLANKPAGFDWYQRGVKKARKPKKFRKGACENVRLGAVCGKRVWQEFVARVYGKSVRQECAARVCATMCGKSVWQQCVATVCGKSVRQESVWQQFMARVCGNSVWQ